MINRSGSRMKSIVIRNCYMADMNVGCVIAKSADRVLIENNLFERGRWETIVVGPSRYWWEGPICENITIRNNTINYPANKYGNTIGNTGKSAIIRVGLDGSTQKVINNVTITGNLIRGSTVNPITVTNSINVNVSNNTFITPEPENANYASYDEAIHSGIFLAGNGGALTVSGNTLTAPGVFSPYLVQFGPGNAPASLIGTDIPAAAPGSLRVTPVSATQFNLLWADNASNETGYIVERRNGGEGSAYTQIATLGANTTTYSDTSTHPTDGTNSYYRVRAVKGALLSAFTDSVAAHLAIPGGGGLTYDYYQGLWHNFQTIPDVSGMRPVLSGETSNFHLSMRERGEYYVVVFKGNIHIPTTGNYTFHTASDDLASLWIDGTVLVAPGPYGAWNQQQSGTRSLSAGQHSIQLTYFQGFGGGNLSVQWTGPGFGQQNIPNASLSRPTPAAATALTATVSGVSTINLAWTDNATNESGYVVERRTGPDGAWIQIASLGVNATSFSNTGVSPGTSYFYRVRALNGSGTSGTNLNGVASAVTTKASVMTWLKADAISGLANGSSLTSWSDTSGQGFHATQANAAQKPTYVTNTIGGSLQCGCQQQPGVESAGAG